jgi:tripartite-type tricarboxylate transporter receptor subunit TctC
VFALIAPARTPDALVELMSQAVAKAMGDAALKDKYQARGLNVSPTKPSETLALMKKDAAKFEKIIREAGIKVE